MLDHAHLDKIMRCLGYVRMKKFVYKASWSTSDVGHYLIFERYGSQKVFLTADFAFRDEAVEPVSYELFKRYSGLPVPDDENINYVFTMRFGFGFLYPKVTSWTFFLPETSNTDLSEKIYKEVTTKLFPVAKPIQDTRALYDRLLADEAPCMWYQTNGALRATHLLQLGLKIGLSLDEVRAALRGHELLIKAGTRKIDPDWYLDRVCEHLKVTLH